MSIALASTYAEPLSPRVSSGAVRPGQRLVRPTGPVEIASKQYLLYGEPVSSEIPLPVPVIRAGAPAATVIFRRGSGLSTPSGTPISVRRGPNGELLSERFQDASGDWIRHTNLGTFHINPELTCVDVYPEPGVADELLGLVLIGQISTFLLGRRGHPCLHASAVTVQGRTAVFVGTNGQGKSTMASCFLARGGTLLTDDALPLRLEGESVYGGPGLPLMKMWQDTANSLALPEELPSLPLLNKKVLVLDGHYPFAAAPARLHQLFVLSRYRLAPGASPEISQSRLGTREALAILLAQTSWSMLLTREEVAQLMPFYARVCRSLPVYVLRFPNGYEYQDQVHRHILDELAQP